MKTRAVNRAAVEKRRVLGEKKTIAIFDAGCELSWDFVFFFFFVEMKRERVWMRSCYLFSSRELSAWLDDGFCAVGSASLLLRGLITRVASGASVWTTVF